MSVKAKNIEPALFSLLEKPLRVVVTRAFDDHYSHEEKVLLVMNVFEALRDKPVDMLVAESNDNHIEIRSAGYGLKDNELDEKTVVLRIKEYFPVRKFWAKVDTIQDEYGEYYLLTLLFPEDY